MQVACIQARVGLRLAGPWQLAWRLLLASCGPRSTCAPISRWDLRRVLILNDHGIAPTNPFGLFLSHQTANITVKDGQTFPCCEASTSPPGVS